MGIANHIALVNAYVRACLRACMRAYVHACMPMREWVGLTCGTAVLMGVVNHIVSKMVRGKVASRLTRFIFLILPLLFLLLALLLFPFLYFSFFYLLLLLLFRLLTGSAKKSELFC